MAVADLPTPTPPGPPPDLGTPPTQAPPAYVPGTAPGGMPPTAYASPVTSPTGAPPGYGPGRTASASGGGWSGGRVAAAVVGVLVILGSVALGASGAGLLLLDRGLRADDGFFTSPTTDLRTDTYAITSEGIDLGSVGPMWGTPDSLLGDARLRVTGAGDEAVFIGIASPDDVAAYLADVRHAFVTEIADPVTTYTELPGGAPSVAPTDVDIWVAQADGTGTQEIVWPLREGAWAAVVMNADGSAAVDVTADVSATFPLLTGLAGGMLAGGVLGLAVGVTLVVVPTLRAGRSRPTAGPPNPPYAPQYAPVGPPR